MWSPDAWVDNEIQHIEDVRAEPRSRTPSPPLIGLGILTQSVMQKPGDVKSRSIWEISRTVDGTSTLRLAETADPTDPEGAVDNEDEDSGSEDTVRDTPLTRADKGKARMIGETPALDRLKSPSFIDADREEVRKLKALQRDYKREIARLEAQIRSKRRRSRDDRNVPRKPAHNMVETGTGDSLSDSLAMEALEDNRMVLASEYSRLEAELAALREYDQTGSEANLDSRRERFILRELTEVSDMMFGSLSNVS
jgi:hypothetical protein